MILIFDLDDTLVQTSSRYVSCLRAFGEYVHARLPEVAAAEATSLVNEIDLEMVLKGGGFQQDRFPAAFVLALERVCRTWRRSVSGQEREEVHALGRGPFEAPYDLFPGVREMLTRYRSEGFRLALCTKGDPEIQNPLKIDHNGLHEIFDDTTGIFPRKTGEEIRSVYERLAGGSRSRGWMIGDSMRDDIVGGHNAGLATVLITDVKDAWSYNRIETAIRPTHSIGRVTELPGVIAPGISLPEADPERRTISRETRSALI